MQDINDDLLGDTEDGMAAPEGPVTAEVIAAQGVDLARELDDAALAQVTTRCLEAYARDKAERADWEDQFDRIMMMVRSGREAKSHPWPGASNVKYPLIMKAALKFGARAYPAIVNGTDVVKSASVGRDGDGEKRKRGDRVSTHMNYQLLLEMPEWDTDTDRLCHALPLQGTMFRQVIWDSEYERPLTTLLSGKELVVTQCAKDLETVPHFAKEFQLFVHQIQERQASGQYLETDLGIDTEDDDEKAGEQELLECHCRYDFDEDGYDEPYIAIIHKQSEKLLSLKPGFWPNGVERSEPEPDESGYLVPGRVIRIRRHVEFIKYEFLPDPDGKFYGIGFGQLLMEHTEVVNSLLNQLIDAATDQNTGGGFVARGFNTKAGNVTFKRGEWKHVNIDGDDVRKAFFARPTSQPSPAMFQLLSLMIDASKDLASDQDIMDGSVPTNTPATTVLAAIEEGMKVFSSIYKRIYRSLTKELRLIAKLNGAYLSPEAYQRVLDEPSPDPSQMQQMMAQGRQPPQPANPQQDYAEQDSDIVPVADPSMTTSAQKLTRAQFLMQVGGGNPLLDQREILRRVLEAGGIDDIEALMPKPDPQAQAKEQEEMALQMRGVMAEILADEAGAQDKTMSARLKFIQGNIAAQEQAVEMASMRHSLMQMMGGFYGPQPYGQGMGGMATIPNQPFGPSTLHGFRGGGPQPAGPMGGAPMGGPGAGPIEGGVGGDQGGFPAQPTLSPVG